MNPNLSVHMICEPIDRFPDIALREGYSLRLYQPGDETTWTAIQRAAEPYFAIEETLFRQEYGDDEAMLAQRMAFVTDADGAAIATISAWAKEDWRGEGAWGQIHWVAVHPDHQRCGISKAMMTWAMHRLAAHYPRAMLGTSTGRVWAIKVYLDFGFLPDPIELLQPEIGEAWQSVQDEIAHARLAAALQR